MKKDSQNTIKKDYLKKITLIKKYNKTYYSDSNPEVSDANYDELKNDILYLEKKYSFLNNEDSLEDKLNF